LAEVERKVIGVFHELVYDVLLVRFTSDTIFRYKLKACENVIIIQE
jgi:hypothetical protein